MLYELLFRRMPLPVALVDRDLNVHDASEAYAGLAGAELSELLGASLAITFASDDELCAAQAAVATGAPFDAIAAAPNGLAVHVRIVALEDGDDRALALLGVAGDSLEETDRLADLCAAIRAIKHEINNPLTGALGNINLLLRRADLDEKMRRRLATAEQEIKKVSQIVLRLSELAMASQPRPTPAADSASSSQ